MTYEEILRAGGNLRMLHPDRDNRTWMVVFTAFYPGRTIGQELFIYRSTGDCKEDAMYDVCMQLKDDLWDIINLLETN